MLDNNNVDNTNEVMLGQNGNFSTGNHQDCWCWQTQTSHDNNRFILLAHTYQELKQTIRILTHRTYIFRKLQINLKIIVLMWCEWSPGEVLFLYPCFTCIVSSSFHHTMNSGDMMGNICSWMSKLLDTLSLANRSTLSLFCSPRNLDRMYVFVMYSQGKHNDETHKGVWGAVFSAVFSSWNRVSTFFAKELNTLAVPM